MGMPLASDDLWTVERVQALPEDGNKYELVWGELLVSPSPRLLHQRVVDRLDHLLDTYCRAHQLGEVFDVAADISWSADTLVQPDVFVISKRDAGAREWSDGYERKLDDCMEMNDGDDVVRTLVEICESVPAIKRLLLTHYNVGGPSYDRWLKFATP